MDNFYISPSLATDLFLHCTHVTGTLDKTRKSVPEEVKTTFNQLSAGTIPRGSGSYIRDRNVVYSMWKEVF